MLVREGESGVALHIRILINFLNVAERRSFSVSSQASDVLYRQHVTHIRRIKGPVERSFVVIRRIVARCCENIAFLIKKFNLSMGVFSLKFRNCAMRHN